MIRVSMYVWYYLLFCNNNWLRRKKVWSLRFGRGPKVGVPDKWYVYKSYILKMLDILFHQNTPCHSASRFITDGMVQEITAVGLSTMHRYVIEQEFSTGFQEVKGWLKRKGYFSTEVKATILGYNNICNSKFKFIWDLRSSEGSSMLPLQNVKGANNNPLALALALA